MHPISVLVVSEDDDEAETDDDDDDKDEDENFKDEDNLVAPSSTRSIEEQDKKKRVMALGLCTLCIILIGLAVGLGVGLSNKDDDPDPTPAPVLAPTDAPLTTAPTTAAAPTSAPSAAGSTEGSALGELFVTASADNTIYREGELQGSNFGDTDTMLAQNGPAGSTDLPDAYSLVQFTTNLTDFANAFDDLDNVVAELCLEHVVNTEPDRQLQYSFCVLNDPGDVDIEALTGNDATYAMPGSCEGQLIMNYPVSPSTTTLCMDVTDLVLNDEEVRLRGRRSRNLKSQLRRNLQVGEDEEETFTFVIMIDLLQELDAPGDRFYTRQNAENAPVLAFTVGGNSTDGGGGDGGISLPPYDGNITGPFEPCSLCVNGTDMTLPDATFSDGGEVVFVCGELEDICQAGFCNTTVCDALTLPGSVFCGCAIDL